ncbi:serine/threonine protein kinase [Corallococcus sp. AB011P]|uniref:serine/threonine protein kinase n=1 Tax=Corallococcus sp. AB011P TaxID=2316735 RepID=UPI000EA1E532|nr:serine/threonine protein kinase [Corallococcus sp. AB011P]RKG56897.1 serine/threonine protein kinase [Corallococcus sp. AB011P]
MTSAPRQVTDINGARYSLLRQLGRGGQGAVYEVDGGRLAAKIVFDSSVARRERLRNQLTQVKRLSLADLEIARPIEMLREPVLGYVMELLTGMQPLKVLGAVPKDAGSPAAWYLAGGGLRRRLQLLARSADVLAGLHGKGLVYSDPSPHNIFVSESPDATEVRFIDADNIHYTSVAGVPAVYTPGYGAPELVRCTSGVNSLTDAHAFSVLTFQTLSLVHPLIGDTVNDGPPEREEEALSGQLPWIDDPTDKSNSASYGIPRSGVLSRKLIDIAGRAFGLGLRDAAKRPGVSEWAECLHGAADATLVCSSCKGTYYLNEKQCPWCDEPRPAFATAAFNLWDPTIGPGGELLQKPAGDRRKAVVAAVLALTDGETVSVTQRLTHGCDGAAGARPVVELLLTGSRLSLRSVDGGRYRLSSPSGGRDTEVTDRVKEIRLEPGIASWRLHIGAPDSLHRVVNFEFRPGGAR